MALKGKKTEDAIEYKMKEELRNLALDGDLEKGVRLFQTVFEKDDTFTLRFFENRHNPGVKCCIAFIEGMVNAEVLNENIIQPIMHSLLPDDRKIGLERLKNSVVVTNNISDAKNWDEAVEAVVCGKTVLLLDGSPGALVINTKGWKTRELTEPESEKTVRGPREGFIESIMVNLALIRRKLETPDLKLEFSYIGVQTHTRICVCYLEGTASPKILEELNNRIKQIKIDSLLASGYIQELIKDAPYTPLKTIGSTERPDVVAAKLLEGHIAIVVDGTSMVLTVPHLFLEYFQANEDYYINFYFSSFSRILRIIGFIVTVTMPALYVALVTFHQEMIPTPLLLSISAARQGVPFPSIVEVIMLLLVFEMLSEAGTRMPTNIGQALSIVGALVLGQASVEARIVSAPVVIIVAISAITSLMLPKLKGMTIILRYLLLLLAAFLGFYGLIFGLTGFLLHLCEIRSFGVPYMLYLDSFNLENMKDTIIRAPWWDMKKKPKVVPAGTRIRQNGGKETK